MGLIRTFTQFEGINSKTILHDGLPGRAEVVDVKRTMMSTGKDFNAHPICVFTLQVTLDDGSPPYPATVRTSVSPQDLMRLTPGSSVAVRVDRRKHSYVALDLAQDVTIPASAPNEGGATKVLAEGTPCRAVVQQTKDLGLRTREGLPMVAFALVVTVAGRAPYTTEVGNTVPPEAQSLTAPGTEVPAKVSPDNPNAVAIDWPAALAELSHPG